MSFTEFCCRSGGSNLNAGTRTGNSTEPGTGADLTYASGNWVASTGVFTPASGDPVADGVAVGDFASVYADGATVTGFVGRVTARTTTTITVSLTARSGTAPTDGTGTRTLKIGGAWQGPNGSSAFPFNFAAGVMVNASGNPPRINMKDDAIFSITANMNQTVGGPLTFQGYTTSYGDLGKATIDGGTTGASYVLLTNGNVGGFVLKDLIWRNNGATGTANLVTLTTGGAAVWCVCRCVFHNAKGIGLSINVTGGFIEEVEAYLNGVGGIASNVSGRRIVVHDNAGYGLNCTNITSFDEVVSDSNTGVGIQLDAIRSVQLSRMSVYNNGSHGFAMANIFGNVQVHIENSSFVKNGGYGIDLSSVSGVQSLLQNNGFGSGTQANASGPTNIAAAASVEETGTVTYASDITPFVDPANGDFRINLAAARGTGRGTFTQTQSGYGGTVGYPDIGAAQSQCTGGGGGGVRMVNIRGGADQ